MPKLMQDNDIKQEQEALERERSELLQRLSDWMETPMLILAFVWLALMVVDLTRGETRSISALSRIIWGIFIVHFILEFILAPRKIAYLKTSWLTAVALLVPALRIFRIARAVRLLRLARVGRGTRLVRVLGSMNRGMRALSGNLQRRGFAYVIALSLLVLLAGAAGMYTFERGIPNGLNSYGESLWWTAMILTTMGSDNWPQTLEGRVLCVLLALYAFAVFGYVTATVATFFIGRDAENEEGELAGEKELAAVRQELSALRDEIRALTPSPPETSE